MSRTVTRAADALARQDERLATARDLVGAPRVLTIAPEMRAAVTLALAHARARLSLPTFDIIWASLPGGYSGQTFFHADGRVEIRLNAASDMSPREVAWVVLHELRHVADGSHLCGTSEETAEARANAFAAHVTDERQTLDFYRLDWRRPSRRH